MNRSVIAFCVFVSVSALGACDSEESSGRFAELPEGPGEFQANYRTSSEFFTAMDARVEGSSPHGEVQIWYSRNIRDLILSGESFDSVPVGTVAIKEGASEPGVVNTITVMIKRVAGYDPDNSNWEYQKRGADAEILKNPDGQLIQGTVPGCIRCHVAASRYDFLSGSFLR